MTKPISRFSSTVIVHKNGDQILLHKRADIRIWSLPGGGLDDGETPEQAAIRETLEETGYQIETDRFVGEYHRPQIRDIRYVFRGFVVGGEPIKRNKETVEVAWFLPTDLPKYLEPAVREIVMDALMKNEDPIVKQKVLPIWQVVILRVMQSLSCLHHGLQDKLRKNS